MKHLLLILIVLFPALVSAEEQGMGERICREEVGQDLMARQHCLRNFQNSAYLVRRYFIHAGLLDEAGAQPPFSIGNMFENPFVLSPRRVVGKCMQGQVFNGNLFSGVVDVRDIWDCISDIDPKAAGWDTI